MDTFLGALWQFTGSYLLIREVLFVLLLLIVLCQSIIFFNKNKDFEFSPGLILFGYPIVEASCWLLRVCFIDLLIKPGQIADTPGWQFIYDLPATMAALSNFLKIFGQVIVLTCAVLAIILSVLHYRREPIRKFILGLEKEGIDFEQIERDKIIVVDTPQRKWRMLLIAIPVLALSIGFAFYCKFCYDNYVPKGKPQTTACIQAVVFYVHTENQLTKKHRRNILPITKSYY